MAGILLHLIPKFTLGRMEQSWGLKGHKGSIQNKRIVLNNNNLLIIKINVHIFQQLTKGQINTSLIVFFFLYAAYHFHRSYSYFSTDRFLS